MPLATVEDVKQHLGKKDANQDSLLKLIVNGVSARIERAIGEQPNDGENVVEILQSHGETRLPLTRRADAIRTVVEGTTTLDPADYRLVNERTLERLASDRLTSWTKGAEVVVTYRPGWQNVPADLILACTTQAAFEYRQTKEGGDRLGLASDSPSGAASGEAQGYVDHDWLPLVKHTIASRRPL